MQIELNDTLAQGLSEEALKHGVEVSTLLAGIVEEYLTKAAKPPVPDETKRKLRQLKLDIIKRAQDLGQYLDASGYVYTLQLQEGKYYVGYSANIIQRLLQHYQLKTTGWVSKYPPVDLIALSKGDRIDETSQTLHMMQKYGIKNVRGGAYTKPPLTLVQEAQILKAMENL